jgi:hypothetical protein
LDSGVRQFMGGSKMSERLSKEFAAIMQNTMMQLADDSIEHDEYSLLEVEDNLNKSLFRAFDQHFHVEGQDTTKHREYVKAATDFYLNISKSMLNEVEPFHDELKEVYGECVPKEILLSHLMQRMQQKMGSIQIPEDLRVKMGIPVTEQERVGHTARSQLQESSQALCKDGKFPEFVQAFFHQTNEGAQVHHKKRKVWIQRVWVCCKV